MVCKRREDFRERGGGGGRGPGGGGGGGGEGERGWLASCVAHYIKKLRMR